MKVNLVKLRDTKQFTVYQVQTGQVIPEFVKIYLPKENTLCSKKELSMTIDVVTSQKKVK